MISTQVQADNAGPGFHKVTDSPGLYLKVSEAGSGSYFFRFRLAGERRDMGLGSRDAIGLADARKAAVAATAQRNKGVDPIEARDRERSENLAKSRAAQPVNFKQWTGDFLEAHGAGRHRYARATWLNPLIAYAYPILGDMPLGAIETRHVVKAMQLAEKAGAPETARRIRARIQRILDAAAVEGLRSKTEANPADARLVAAGYPLRRRGDRPHYRAVDLDEAPGVFQRLKVETGAAFAAWVFMILCAARPGEALGARWGEIDSARALWTVPAARMKTGRVHIVPLSIEALAILRRQERVRTGDAIFPGNSGSPLAYSSFATAPTKAGIDAAAPHGWRSVFRDWCGDKGDIPREIAEAALAHSLGSVEGSYRRRTAVERRRTVMESYSRWLSGDVAQVLSFPTRDGSM